MSHVVTNQLTVEAEASTCPRKYINSNDYTNMHCTRPLKSMHVKVLKNQVCAVSAPSVTVLPEIEELNEGYRYIEFPATKDPHCNRPRKMTSVIFFSQFGVDFTKTGTHLQGAGQANVEKWYTLTKEGTFACRRIGAKPASETTLLLLVEGAKAFVLEQADRKTLYGNISDDQHRRIRARHSKAHHTEPRLFHIATKLAGVTKKKTCFYSLTTWNKMMDEMQNIKPTGAVKVVSGGKRVYNAVARILAALQEKQEAFEELTSMGVAVTENDREVLAPILSELEVCLTHLYCLDWAEYKDAFAEELVQYKEQKKAALLSKIAQSKPVVAQVDGQYEQYKIGSRIKDKQTTVNQHAKVMATTQGTAEDLACHMLCDPRRPFARGLAPHVVTMTDLKSALESKHLASDTVNISGLRHFLRNISFGLQMLVATRDTPNPFHKNASQSGWLKRISMNLSTHEQNLRAAKTQEPALKTISLTFSKSASQLKQEQCKSFLSEMYEHVWEKMPKNEHDIKEKLNKLLMPYGGYTQTRLQGNKSSDGTNVGKWKNKEKQRDILKNLSWLWFLANETVSFDGSVEDFITIYLESAFGEWLIRAFMAYRSRVGKILGDAVKMPLFICPSICTVSSPRRGKQLTKLVFGAEPLELCIDYVWSRIQLEWPTIPTDHKAQVARARMIVFVTMWSLVEKYSMRVHNLDKFSIITPEEKRQRHPMNWDGYEMENGVTIVADQYNVTVEILDTKLVVANSDKKRDWNLHGSYFYTETLCIAGNWQPNFEWFQSLWKPLQWAVSVLAPANRFYTSSIYDMNSKTWSEVPVTTVPLPTTPNDNKLSLQIDQTKFPVYKKYQDLHAEALKRLELCKTEEDYKQHGVRATPFPSRPKADDYTPAARKNMSSDTSVFHAENMQHFISTFGTKFSLATQKRLNWKLSVYNPEAKRKRGANNEYHFQPLQSMSELLGLPRLFGGRFGSNDLSSLAALAQGCLTRELIFDIKSARHSCIAMYYAFQEVFKRFVSRSDHGLTTGWEEKRNEVKVREVHMEDKTNKLGYCKQTKLYDICRPSNWYASSVIDNKPSFILRKIIWSHPCMKNAQGEYHADAIQLGTENPIKHWPTGLVTSLKPDHDQSPPLVRCGDMEMLTLHEQIQQLWTLRACRTWFEYLHSRHEMFSTDAGLVNLRAFVKDICTPPPIELRSSPRLPSSSSSSSSRSSSSSSSSSSSLPPSFNGPIPFNQLKKNLLEL